jgi:hypothetical protein
MVRLLLYEGERCGHKRNIYPNQSWGRLNNRQNYRNQDWDTVDVEGSLSSLSPLRGVTSSVQKVIRLILPLTSVFLISGSLSDNSLNVSHCCIVAKLSYNTVGDC